LESQYNWIRITKQIPKQILIQIPSTSCGVTALVNSELTRKGAAKMVTTTMILVYGTNKKEGIERTYHTNEEEDEDEDYWKVWWETSDVFHRSCCTSGTDTQSKWEN